MPPLTSSSAPLLVLVLTMVLTTLSRSFTPLATLVGRGNAASLLRPGLYTPTVQTATRAYPSTTLSMARKAGVSEPSELREFVQQAGDKLLVVDVRNANVDEEPGDQKSFAVGSLPDGTFRPQGINLVWNRTTHSMPLPPDNLPKDTPIITHCGGGGRGQKAKDFLEKHGYTKVLNGGGPKLTDCWAEYGDK
eukprot:Nitzschia sp. Nitz4//scaffold87_size112219//45798//46373//NITZ4_004072-RA/size112219-processed-gene-0.5-mRNA-1//1//CDS//3329559363//2810//frame0